MNNKVGGDTEINNDEIKVGFKKGEYGGPKGLRIRIRPLYFPVMASTLSYKLYLPEDFEVIKGGKLPGFSGACGCHDGFCTRIMWRRHLDTEIYCHGPKQDEDYYKNSFIFNPKYGDSIGRGKAKLTTGWNTVSLSIRLNDIGKSNGVMRMNINGTMYSFEQYRFRECEHIKIDTVLLVMFYGGSNTSWAPTKDTYAIFKDIKYF